MSFQVNPLLSMCLRLMFAHRVEAFIHFTTNKEFEKMCMEVTSFLVAKEMIVIKLKSSA